MEKNEIDLVGDQVSKTLADHRIIDVELKAKITHMIVETSMSSYREGFHNGGASNGGFNRGIKQIMRHMSEKGTKIRYENDLSDKKEIRSVVRMIDSNISIFNDAIKEDNIEKALYSLVIMQRNLFGILCYTGLSDIFTESFEEIVNCDLANRTIDPKDVEKIKVPDLAGIIKRKNELVALMREKGAPKTEKPEVKGDASVDKK